MLSKKILVTGVAGFLGSHLAEKLSNIGHEVIGVTMKLWEGENGEMPETGCCTASDSEDARKVAGKLDIPYYVLDYTDQYRLFLCCHVVFIIIHDTLIAEYDTTMEFVNHL